MSHTKLIERSTFEVGHMTCTVLEAKYRYGYKWMASSTIQFHIMPQCVHISSLLLT